MRILTIGASPYLLVRNGRMNADVIAALRSQGHQVASACWHHDEGYFLPEAGTGEHVYEDADGKPICQLFPFIFHPEHATAQVYEIMKKFAPEIVISIGDYKETDFIYAIKAMYPVFKWIAVVTVDCLPINESHIDFLDYADLIISTSSFGADYLASKCKKKVKYLPYGPDHTKFYRDENIVKNNNFLCLSKNALSNNLGNVIKATKDQDIYLHTNIYDPGEFDIMLLIERYDSKVRLPEEFVSIKDSISDESLNCIYNAHKYILDCSVKSATALNLLEAMSAGCVPVGVDSGMVGEIISMMPPEFRYIIPSVKYIGQSEEEFSVVSAEGILNMIEKINKDLASDADFLIASRFAMQIASHFSNTAFLNNLLSSIETVKKEESQIVLDTFLNK